MSQETAIQSAIWDIERGVFSSARAAATAYQIDHGTLSRRRRGGQSHSAGAEMLQALSPLSEESLVEWILEAERAGHAFNHAQLREMASLIDKASGGNGFIGKNWVIRFIQRQPTIQTKLGRSIPNMRVTGLYQTTFASWFERLATLISHYSIAPANFWNMDETGTSLGVQTNQTIIGSTNSNMSLVKASDNREHVSIIECVSSTDRVLKPVVIFKGQSIQRQWFNQDTIPDWLFVAADKAYVNSEISLEWLRNVFLPETAVGLAPGAYRLLIVDGYKAHIDIPFMWLCRLNKVLPYYLVAHSSHFTQPLDIACFASLKTRYRGFINNQCNSTETAVIMKLHFLNFYQNARNEAFSKANIQSGWRAAGLVPWKPELVYQSRFIIQQNPDEITARGTTPDRPIVNPAVLQTPTNRFMFDSMVRNLDKSTPLNRETRAVFRKAGKAVDKALYDVAAVQYHLTAAQSLLADNRIKRQKRKAVDPNGMFVNIDDLKKQYDAKEEAATAKRKAKGKSKALPIVVEEQEEEENPFDRVTRQLRSMRQ